jgi:glycosyltransferase involved in cell wall biosynthesis/peptidoglycan/xylan/chitin deacetylase (PgdA/CDA1 family)
LTEALKRKKVVGDEEEISLQKLLAILEAGSVTGPAKNLMAFCQSALEHSFANLPRIETSITTFRRASAIPFTNPFVEKVRDLGIEIDVVEERFRFDRRVIDDLKTIVDRVKPNIIQTHNVKSHFLIRLSGLWREIPWVAFHHGYTTTDLKMRAYNQLDRWSLRKAHRVVTMNKNFADQLVRAGAPAQSMRILHNAVDIESLSQVSKEETTRLKLKFGIAENEQVVIAIGRMSLEKGHSDLIKAFAKLLQTQPEQKTKLVLVGEGPERERLEQEVASVSPKDSIVFAGQVNDVKPFYAIADLLVLPSHSEGSPNVLLEAMAAKVPAVATAVGGVPEIATHNENALLVKARDAAAMAQAMKQLLNDRELARRLTENAQERVKNHHSPEARLRSLLEIYRELMPSPVFTTSQFVERKKMSEQVIKTLEAEASANDFEKPWKASASSRSRLFLKEAIYFLYLYSGYVALRDFVLACLGRSRAVVLYYHRVGGRDVWTKPSEEFRKELAYLKSQYECISFAQLCDRLRSNKPMRRRAVVITFDDGYRDNFTKARPALKEAEVPATFFVATGFISAEREFAHDLRALDRGDISTAHFPKLTWDDLRLMEAEGFEIGSHTINHTNMGSAEATKIDCEVRESLAMLNRELGEKPRAFSFPWGKPQDLSGYAIEIARQAGYYSAVSAYGGANTRGANLFNIRRLDVGNGEMSKLAVRARIAGFDRDYYRLKLKQWDI